MSVLYGFQDKVAFFLEFPKTEEILAERVLKIGPNSFLEVIVKWLGRYLTFRFFWNSTYVRRFSKFSSENRSNFKFGAKNEK